VAVKTFTYELWMGAVELRLSLLGMAKHGVSQHG
jgi:hypothetical protein